MKLIIRFIRAFAVRWLEATPWPGPCASRLLLSTALQPGALVEPRTDRSDRSDRCCFHFLGKVGDDTLMNFDDMSLFDVLDIPFFWFLGLGSGPAYCALNFSSGYQHSTSFGSPTRGGRNNVTMCSGCKLGGWMSRSATYVYICNIANTSVFSAFIVHAAVKAMVKAQLLHLLFTTARLGLARRRQVGRCVSAWPLW